MLPPTLLSIKHIKQHFDDATISRFFSQVASNSLAIKDSKWNINKFINPMAWVNFLLIISVFYEAFKGILLPIWTNRKR